MITFNRAGRFLAPALMGALLTLATLHHVSADQKQPQLIGTVNELSLIGPDTKWTHFKTQRNAFVQERDNYQKILAEFSGDGTNDAVIPPVEPEVMAAWISIFEKSVLHGPLSDADQKALTGYESKGKAAIERLVALQNTQGGTDADKAELAKLTQLKSQTIATLGQKAQEYQAQLNTDEKTLNDSTSAALQAAITKAADEQGVTYVFNANIVTSGAAPVQQTILYSTDKNLDITDQVLKQLNAAK